MCKADIFNEIIQVVSRETEIAPKVILSGSKEAEAVDARYLLVYFLFKEGFYPSQIASLVGKTKRAVNYMLSNFSSRVRCGKMMGIYRERIGNELGNN